MKSVEETQGKGYFNEFLGKIGMVGELDRAAAIAVAIDSMSWCIDEYYEKKADCECVDDVHYGMISSGMVKFVSMDEDESQRIQLMFDLDSCCEFEELHKYVERRSGMDSYNFCDALFEYVRSREITDARVFNQNGVLPEGEWEKAFTLDDERIDEVVW